LNKRNADAAGCRRFIGGDILRAMQSTRRFRLDPEVARFSISPEEIGPIDTPPTPRAPGRVIGQPRAVEALKLAVAIRAKGYNVFVAGLSGTGKRSTVMRFLKEQPFDHRTIRDIVAVNNFAQPDRPRILYFSAGDGRRFRRRVDEAVSALQERIPLAFEQGAFREQRDEIMFETEHREAERLNEFESRLNEEGFTVVQVGEQSDQRSDLHVLIEDQAVAIEDLADLVQKGRLSDREWHKLRRRYYQLMDEMNRIFLTLRGERMVAENRLREIQREAATPVVQEIVDAIRSDFVGEEIHQHVESMRADVIENLGLFLPDDPEKEEEREIELLRYRVNVLVDHFDTQQTPVIFESRPDYHKIFGTQEINPDHDGRHGFLSLRSGSLLAASGGFIVLRAEDVLSQEEVWHGIKRAIQDEVTEIRTPPTPYGPPMQSLKPDPIAINVKLILMGSENIYDILFYQDEEFGKLFKVLSEFDSVMENTTETRRAYVDFMHMITGEEKLISPDADGMAAIVEYGVRLGEFRDKLSTRFSLIADLLRESSHWAATAGRSVVDREAVEQAREMRRFLHNLPEEKYDEQISSGEMILQVDGTRIGAINGLSVLDRGYYAFGRPMLITARVAPGTDGIINIERESGLSGELHDKGVYIIHGFLQATYATDFPLAINASIGFEQSYVEVDGDSASSTEVYVLLSAIGNLPLRQDIAVTGSVNQFGQIQPVGGISEKIEGFYATCRLMGLTGEQGVIIPRTNIQNLILSREVQTAVDEARFHIYAIDTVDEGIEILTGKTPGVRQSDGHFPKNTVNGIVERRLRQMAAQVKDFS
jgi:predicted ATP-dependent protease